MSNSLNLQNDIAWLLIDMQTEFISNLDSSKLKAMVQSQVFLLDSFASKNVPVIVLEYDDSGETMEPLREAVKKVPVNHYVTKFHDDGFSSRELNPLLKSMNVGHVGLMGINAPFCVMETARSAISNGFKLVTSECILGAQSNREGYFRDSIEWYQKNSKFFYDEKEVIDAL